jgi:hypothetical protein
MVSPGHAVTIGAYSAQGGNLWLAGGGIAGASQYGSNSRSNDVPTISFSASAGELVEGAFMYEYPAWRSAIRPVTTPSPSIQRYLGRKEGGSEYGRLPARMELKTQATDPPSRYAPYRTDPRIFLQTSVDLEYLLQGNHVIEDYGTPGRPDLRSTLDTLYHADASTLPNEDTNPYNVVMTVQRSRTRGPVVFTGFDLWHYQRAQLVAMVDVVLQDVFGMARGAASGAARSAVRPARSPRSAVSQTPSAAATASPSRTPLAQPGQGPLTPRRRPR